MGNDLLVLSREIIKTGKDIVLFTGYELQELSPKQNEIVNLSSVVIAGRYIESLRDTNLLLRGSRNQKIINNDKRVQKYYQRECRQVEVIIEDDKDTYLGFPEDFI